MKILIVGNGGREHTLLWKLNADKPGAQFFITIGNGGTQKLARSLEIDPTDVDGIVAFAVTEGVDLVVVGPEIPLELGLSDRLGAEGVPTFGPSKAAAEIETSKAFAKNLMKKYGIPTADFAVFTSFEKAVDYVASSSVPLVVKASGLAAGKGAIVCDDARDAVSALEMMMKRKAFGEAGNEVVLEERLEGEELSFFVLTDGRKVIPLSPSQDHKRVNDGDRGPNTGGMGAYAPVSIATPALTQSILDTIVLPTIDAMREEGRPYRGVLYTGLMLTEKGPKVIEFNARFGDPEAQVNLPLISSSLLECMQGIAAGRLDSDSVQFREGSAVCVVLASGGYPGHYEKGKVINIPAGLESDSLLVFHAGTRLMDGVLVTSGGRVLGITALGRSTGQAIEACYQAAGKITFDNRHFRTDIGSRELSRIAG